jgi:hypothetical protein
MTFRCTTFNLGRTFHAEDVQDAAARVADHLARKTGGRRACAWTLREESISPDRSLRRYSSTAGMPTKQRGEVLVIGESWTVRFVLRVVGGAK